MSSLSPEALPPSPSSPSATADKTYQAGSLRYTARGLLVLALWLLWGDFAFSFFESIFAKFIPLYLKDQHASNALIGVMTGSIAGVVNVLFLPNISQWSDHYRGRLGRRIPFLCVVAPLAVGSLVAVGFAPEIGGFLHAHVLSRLAPSVALAAAVLVALCTLVVFFHFFNMVLVNAYTWLLRDVVPQEMIGRFLSWFRIVGTAASFSFFWFVFPYVLSHRKEVFIGVGLLYLAAFFLMCYKVKEGEYPPPPPKETRPGLAAAYGLYFRECLSQPIYRNFFAAYVLVIVAITCAGPFSVLFMRETLHLDMGHMGKLLAWGAASSTLALLLLGWLCDRFSPFHVALASLAASVALSLLAFPLVQGQASLLVYTLAFAVPAVGWGLGSTAASMRVFPAEKFGQFSSGFNVFGCGALVVGNYLIGLVIDWTGSNYRVTFLWSAALFTLALWPMFRVYREWKRLGGPGNYVAPLPS